VKILGIPSLNVTWIKNIKKRVTELHTSYNVNGKAVLYRYTPTNAPNLFTI
jgi:hypothetical protein